MNHFDTRKILTTMAIVAIFIFSLPASMAAAEAAAARYPGTGADITGVGTVTWGGTGNITNNDTNYATASLNTYTGNPTSHYLRATNFGFNNTMIPDDAIITGIQVTIGRYDSSNGTGSAGDVYDSIVRLVKNLTITGDNKAATATPWPGSEGIATYGGSADLWGESWNPADLTSANFGVVLSATTNIKRQANVDYFQITVSFKRPTTSTVNCGAGTPIVVEGGTINCVVSVTRGSGSLTPTGSVTWATDSVGNGTFSPAASCALVTSVAGTATCNVNYNATAAGDGTHLLTATYGGDGNFTGISGSQEVTVSVGQPPIITEGASIDVAMDEDGSPTAFSLTLNATDADSVVLTWSISVPALHGTAGASGNGLSKAITYSPTPNYNGSDSFTVQVSDGALWDSITVNVNITPIADTLYVDKTVTCDDSGPGSLALPLCTIDRGEFLARAGDTVHVLNGTYAETVWVDTYSGVAGYPITYFADPGVVVTGNGSPTTGAAFIISLRSYIVVEGFTITGTAYSGIYAVNSDHITIKNNDISDSGQHVFGEHQHAIRFKTVIDSLIDNNLTYDNSCIGIRLTHASNNNVVSNNTSYGNYSAVAPGEPTDAAGIELDDSDNNLVIHNITYSNEDSGINLYKSTGDGSNNNKVIGNLSYGNGDHGIDNNNSSGQIIVGNTVHGNYTSGINLEANSGGATITNNIVSQNGLNPVDPLISRKPGNIYVDDTSVAGTTMDYNLYYLSGGTVQIDWNDTAYSTLAAFQAVITTQEDHGLEGNPLFVAPAPVSNGTLIVTEGDYHLLALSPAIDSANSNAPDEPSTDLDGNPRVDDPAVANTGAGTRLYDDRGVYEKQIPLATNLTTSPITDTYGQTVTLSATLTRTSNGVGLNNKTISFTLNGVVACSGITDSSGIATCTAALTADVGTYASGVGASFAGDGIYAPSTATAQLVVNAKHITGSFTAADKVYDGSAAATVLTRSLTGVLVGDAVELTSGTATFANKNVGEDKVVTLGSALLSGLDAGNYVLDSVATTTASITALHVTGAFTAGNKVYDGTTDASVLTRSLVGAISGDAVELTGGTAAFADKTVGTGKVVTLSGAALSGADAGNYVLDSVATTTASITALHVTGAFTAADKVYDREIAAVVLTRSLVGAILGDAVELNGGAASFADKTVATGKVVTLTGAALSGLDAGNYVLDSVATTTASITALHVTGAFTAGNKVYDGTTDASVLTRSLVGAISGDAVELTGGTAAFADKTVGTGKVVTLSGAALSGADAGNYVLDSVATTTASITALHITGSFTAADKVYDGNAAATVLTRSLTGVLAGDAVELTGGTATFANKTVGEDKVVTLGSALLSGADAGNYALDSVATTSASISALHITGAFTAADKVYDGTVNATVLTRSLVGAILGDAVELSAGIAAFADKTVATGKVVTLSDAVLSGVDAGNYVLDSVATDTADITAKPLTVSGITAQDKVYDGNTQAVIDTTTATLVGKITGDVVTLEVTGALGTFADKNVGNGKDVAVSGLSISGDDAGNYSLTQPTTTADITVRDLTVGATGIDKVYDGTTAATVTLTDNRVTGDVFIASYTSASFADANAGSGISMSVIGISIAGVDAGNYNLLNTTAATTANITPKPITVTANSGQYKIFGTVDPVFTYTYAPNDPPIAFSGLLSREPGEEIGGYAITQGTLSAGSNYAINFVSATFRITGELMYLPFVRK